MPSLKRWIEFGRLPGHFLQAVLKNDLKEACMRADDENIANLPAYAAYLYVEAPAGCHGSPEQVKAWLKYHAEKRADAAMEKQREEK